MNECSRAITTNHRGPSSDKTSLKKLQSRKEMVEDEHVLRGAEILRAQLLAATRQRLDQQLKNPLLRSSRTSQRQPLEKTHGIPAQEAELLVPGKGSTCDVLSTKITRKSRQPGSSSFGTGDASQYIHSDAASNDATGAIADLCRSADPLSSPSGFLAKIKERRQNRPAVITNIVSASNEASYNDKTIDHSDTLSSSTDDFLNVNLLSPSQHRAPLAPIEKPNTSWESSPNSSATEKSVTIPASKEETRAPSNVGMNNCPLKDNAYRHAQLAGLLWQTLVGQQVRFPKTWYNGQRSRPMMSDATTTPPWLYLSKHRVRANPFLNYLIQSPNPTNQTVPKGRLLLHLIIQHEVSLRHVQDVVVGCFHPKYARHASSGNKLLSSVEEDSRDVWMAVRKAGNNNTSEESNVGTEFLLDSILCVDTKWKKNKNIGKKSPIGDQKGLVTNDNVAAIYGDKPPLKTAVINERVAYNLLQTAKERCPVGNSNPVSILLLQEFLFK
jgi:hypothetical protein